MSERRIVEDRLLYDMNIEDENAYEFVTRLMDVILMHGRGLVFRREYDGSIPGNFYLASRRYENDFEYEQRLAMERERSDADKRRARERIVEYKARYPDLFE
jgi:hypothetical protein